MDAAASGGARVFGHSPLTGSGGGATPSRAARQGPSGSSLFSPNSVANARSMAAVSSAVTVSIRSPGRVRSMASYRPVGVVTPFSVKAGSTVVSAPPGATVSPAFSDPKT